MTTGIRQVCSNGLNVPKQPVNGLLIGQILDVKAAMCREFDYKETIQLLRINVNIWWSWAVTKITVENPSKPYTKVLRFRVRGHHHKGHVYIFVNGMDLYDVYLTNLQGKIVKCTEGLYFDMLQDWIDTNVERIPAYKQ